MASPARTFVIRRALRGEADGLSELALRSKAHWGYSEDFLEIVSRMLRFTDTDLVDSPVYVLEGSEGPAGMYRLTGVPPLGELEDLWLTPEFIGLGVGRGLFEHALQTAAQLGFAALQIESDPNAEGFYLRMGATRIGVRRSLSGRTLPLLRVDAWSAERARPAERIRQRRG